VIIVNVCDKVSSYYTEIICSDDFYQSFGKPVQDLNEKEKKAYLEILKSEIIEDYLLKQHP